MEGHVSAEVLSSKRLHEARLTSCIMEKMTPNSVFVPVPTTIPEPCPFLTSVPMKAMHDLSLSPSPPFFAPSCELMSGTHASVPLRAGLVSPVSALSSTSSSTAEMSRTSAGTRSPTAKVTRSPGTSVLASRVSGCESLRGGGSRKKQQVSEILTLTN